MMIGRIAFQLEVSMADGARTRQRCPRRALDTDRTMLPAVLDSPFGMIDEPGSFSRAGGAVRPQRGDRRRGSDIVGDLHEGRGESRALRPSLRPSHARRTGAANLLGAVDERRPVSVAIVCRDCRRDEIGFVRPPSAPPPLPPPPPPPPPIEPGRLPCRPLRARRGPDSDCTAGIRSSASRICRGNPGPFLANVKGTESSDDVFAPV